MPGKKGSGHGGCQQTHSPTKHPQLHLSPCPPVLLPLTRAVPSGRAGDSPTVTATRSGALARPACCARRPTPLAGSCSLPVLPLRFHPAPRYLWLPEAWPSFGAKASDCPRGSPSRRGRQPVPLLPSQGPGTPARPAELRGGPHLTSCPGPPQYHCPGPGTPVLIPTGPSPPAARFSCAAQPCPRQWCGPPLSSWCPCHPTPSSPLVTTCPCSWAASVTYHTPPWGGLWLGH